MSTDISVIIPAKDRLWSLPKAVESCRSSHLKIEIIVIDDGSTDGTAEWLQGQPDIVRLQGYGWGKPWGVNQAMVIASGKYIRFLDSDDWLYANANDTQFALAEAEQADVVLSNVDIYQDDVFLKRMDWVPSDDFIAQQLGEASGSHYSAFLFRKEFIRDIPHRTLFSASGFASNDDRCFTLEVALRSPRISISPHPALCHRHHNKSRLQFRSGFARVGTNIQTLYIYRQILNLLDQKGELTLRRKRAAIKILWPLAHWIAYTNLNEACEVAAWIYRLDPEFHPPEPGVLGKLYASIGFRRTELILYLRRTLLSVFRKK